ncbi:DUF1657 domain-containing protein [Alkaliphilus metalliredigens]|nr:DUF1657 domain-containing protein [Alkaliphilus metalliredigens]
MTVQSDLEKAIAYCEATKGTYALMSHSTEDQQAKEMFNMMKSDLEKHIQFLNSRLEYLSINNPLNQNN